MIVVTPYISKTLRPDQISKPDDGFTGFVRSAVRFCSAG